MSFIYWILCLAAFSVGLATSQDVNRPPYHELSKQSLSIDNKAALFGYSIAYQKDLNSMVVGAPLDNNVGGVYTCSVDTMHKNITCDDKFEVNKGALIEYKTHHSWLGATVNAGEKYFMACAPRGLFKKDLASFSSGKCFYKETEPWNTDKKLNTMTAVKKKIEYYKSVYMTSKSPIRTEKTTDTFGLTSYVDHNTTGHIFVGGHAMSVGQTLVYRSYKDSDPKYIPVNNTDLSNKQKKISLNFGYSITSGKFSKNYNQIAISTPYGSIGYGRVYFYRFNDDKNAYEAEDMWVDGQNDTNIVGSMFGASLASLGLENGRSALLVGAPAYIPSHFTYDVGAVFIYTFDTQNFESKTIFKKKLLGKDSKSGDRFGTAIVTVGDFDGDNIDEVAVAAPYENGGKGAVYLYSGRKLLEGSDNKVPWMQKFLPEDQPTEQSLFGLALNVPDDADQNGCNELAIGAPGVSAVTLLRCLASVEISFLPPEFPDLTKQREQIHFKDIRFSFKQCFEVKPFSKPEPLIVEKNTAVTFTINVIHPHVSIDGPVLVKNLKSGETCIYPAIVLPKDGDYDREVKFDVSVKLKQNPLTMETFNPGLVLINKGISSNKIFPLKPSLPGSKLTFRIDTSLKDDYLIGSTESEWLNISVSNAGNLAHDACVIVRFNGVTIADPPKGRKCSLANGELTCPIQRLGSGEHWELQLTLSTKPLTSSQQKINITSVLRKSGCSVDTNQRDEKIISLTRDNKIKIKTYSKPDLKVNVTEEQLQKGKTIDHIYRITNYGLTTWTNVSCTVTLPAQVKIEKVQTQALVDCKLINATHTVCNMTELRQNNPVDIIVHMKILPDSPFADQIRKEKVTVETELNLLLMTTTQSARITTTLTLWLPPEVPLWMIIVATLFGLLIIVILLWVLHECGCLQRTNKETLKELKKDIRRQSMRKSTMLRQSVINVIPNDATNTGDRQQLISVAEGDTTSQDGCLGDSHLQDGQIKDGRIEDDRIQDGQIQDGADEARQNARPVKELHKHNKDPATVAFNAELQKALIEGALKKKH